MNVDLFKMLPSSSPALGTQKRRRDCANSPNQVTTELRGDDPFLPGMEGPLTTDNTGFSAAKLARDADPTGRISGLGFGFGWRRMEWIR